MLTFDVAIFDVVKMLISAIFDNACNLCPCRQNEGRMSVRFQQYPPAAKRHCVQYRIHRHDFTCQIGRRSAGCLCSKFLHGRRCPYDDALPRCSRFTRHIYAPILQVAAQANDGILASWAKYSSRSAIIAPIHPIAHGKRPVIPIRRQTRRWCRRGGDRWRRGCGPWCWRWRRRNAGYEQQHCDEGQVTSLHDFVLWPNRICSASALRHGDQKNTTRPIDR